MKTTLETILAGEIERRLARNNNQEPAKTQQADFQQQLAEVARATEAAEWRAAPITVPSEPPVVERQNLVTGHDEISAPAPEADQLKESPVMAEEAARELLGPGRYEVITDPAFGASELARLDEYLAANAGGLVNPKGLRISDFEHAFYTSEIVWPGGSFKSTGCLFRKPGSEAALNSSTLYWKNFWTLSVELNQLA